MSAHSNPVCSRLMPGMVKLLPVSGVGLIALGSVLTQWLLSLLTGRSSTHQTAVLVRLIGVNMQLPLKMMTHK